MYSKFNCKISDEFYNASIDRYSAIGKEMYEHFEKQSQNCIKHFLLDNGHIDGSALKNNWFKISEADIFISHSHKDIDKVIAFAGWLNAKFNLKVFIDSCAWGYCNDLLKQIDDKYCKSYDTNLYNYNLRNYSTSHVHTMLSTALLEMIDNVECLMFYNTPESICLKDELVKIDKQEKTLSPWIYHELSIASMVRQSVPERNKTKMRESLEHMNFLRLNDDATVDIEYDLSEILNTMQTLDEELLIKWQFHHTQNIRNSNKRHALDVLYNLVKS